MREPPRPSWPIEPVPRISAVVGRRPKLRHLKAKAFLCSTIQHVNHNLVSTTSFITDDL